MLDYISCEKGVHAKYECPKYKVMAPDIKTMQICHEAKHPKLPYEEDKIVNLHGVYAQDSSKTRPRICGILTK